MLASLTGSNQSWGTPWAIQCAPRNPRPDFLNDMARILLVKTIPHCREGEHHGIRLLDRPRQSRDTLTIYRRHEASRSAPRAGQHHSRGRSLQLFRSGGPSGGFQSFYLTAGLTNVADKTPPFVSGQPLTTDTATCDIIGRTDDVGFESKF